MGKKKTENDDSSETVPGPVTKLTITLQPEVAYLKRNGEIVSWEPPPPGYLFVAHHQNIPLNATEDEVFTFMKGMLCPLPTSN